MPTIGQRKRLGPRARRRVSEKIGHLIEGGEMPNTPEGRRHAAGMAYGMEGQGRLGPRGAYRRVSVGQRRRQRRR